MLPFEGRSGRHHTGVHANPALVNYAACKARAPGQTGGRYGQAEIPASPRDAPPWHRPAPTLYTMRCRFTALLPSNSLLMTTISTCRPEVWRGHAGWVVGQRSAAVHTSEQATMHNTQRRPIQYF